jgi:hypothetical protein
MTPTLQTSTAGEQSLRWSVVRSSGAMYSGEPQTVPRRGDVALLRPKSAILTTACGRCPCSRMFSSFRSPCTMPLLCRYATPSSTCPMR